MKTKSRKIKTAADLEFATKDDMYKWIENCPKLGGAWLKFYKKEFRTYDPDVGFSEREWNQLIRWEFTQQFRFMNKDGLKVLIRAVMSA